MPPLGIKKPHRASYNFYADDTHLYFFSDTMTIADKWKGSPFPIKSRKIVLSVVRTHLGTSSSPLICVFVEENLSFQIFFKHVFIFTSQQHLLGSLIH